jgi:hypothetical protein
VLTEKDMRFSEICGLRLADVYRLLRVQEKGPRPRWIPLWQGVTLSACVSRLLSFKDNNSMKCRQVEEELLLLFEEGRLLMENGIVLLFAQFIS